MTLLLFIHFISFVSWFAGLFYLPRLYVYHAATDNQAVYQQFLVMEYKLYYYIMTPAAVVTILSGFGLAYVHFSSIQSWPIWFIVKLVFVGMLILFHISCGKHYYRFKHNHNTHPHTFFRFFNEFPTIILLVVIALALWQPGF